jgi:hypothetical protein
MREDERDRVSRQGTEAWRRLKREKNWHDWVKVGEALQVGREWAMGQASTNRPEGKAYNTTFGEWLQRYKLDDMDKGDRSRLFSVMDNLPMIEDWRRTLTLTERLKLNHPNAVLRKWKAAVEPERPASGRPTLRDSVVNLSEENAAQKAEIANLKMLLEEERAARAAGVTAPADAITGGDREPTAAPPAGIAGALTVLLGAGRFGLQDLSGYRPDHLDLVELTKCLTDIAVDLKRMGKQAGKAEPAKAGKGKKASTTKTDPHNEFLDATKAHFKSLDEEAEADDDAGALVWTDEALPQAPATKGRYQISLSSSVLFGGSLRHYYAVAYQPDGTSKNEQSIGRDLKDVATAMHKAQAHHDAGKDR